MHENLFISFMACALAYMLLTIILMRWGRFSHERTPTLQVCRLSCTQAGRWWWWRWACRAWVFMCESCSQRSNVVKEATAKRPKPNRDTEKYENIWSVVGLSVNAATQHLAENRWVFRCLQTDEFSDVCKKTVKECPHQPPCHTDHITYTIIQNTKSILTLHHNENTWNSKPKFLPQGVSELVFLQC